MKILVTGAHGMVGKSLSRVLERFKKYDLYLPKRDSLNLLSQPDVFTYVQKIKPDMVIHLAARVGGIQANINNPVSFLYENLMMGLNIVNAALQAGVDKLINLGSSCIYPSGLGYLAESDLLMGELEKTNEGYALGKISILKLCTYIAQEYGYQYKTIIPCNLYGPFDNFDLISGHLVPSILHKLHLAKEEGREKVSIWGDGAARREFLYVDDLIDFILFGMQNLKILPSHINVGLGIDYTINQYYHTAAEVVGYTGKFSHDLTKPVGMRQKLLNISTAQKFGWCPKVDIKNGMEKTYRYFLSRMENKVNDFY